jgi:chemotaxis response regulator CheB
VLKFTRLETGVRKGEVIMELLTEKVHSKLSTIDGAMASLATVFKKNIIAVLLTGMGEDGLVGVKEVKQAGGYVIAQDPNTAAVRSMPEAVIQAQLVDAVLSPEKIIDKIIEQCQSI